MKHSQQGRIFTKIVLETFKLNGLFTAEGDKITEPFGLSSARWKIISSLARSKSPLTVSQIAQAMGQTRQAVQRLVDVLQNDKFIVLLDNPNHKRAKLIILTDQGKNIYRNLEKKQVIWANKFSNYIDKKDLEITLMTLEKLSEFDGKRKE